MDITRRQPENTLATMEGGNIVLYTRSNTSGSTIHYRIRIPGLAGYERKSTKEWNLEDAKVVAKERYDELRFEKKKGGRTSLPKTIRAVATNYLTWLQKQVAIGKAKKSKYRTHRQLLEKSLIPYFGKKDIDGISTKDLIGYETYRLEQPKRVNNKGEGDATKRVSLNTIAAEKSCLSSLMWYAINVIEIMKQVERPAKGWGSMTPHRRPAFTQQQMDELSDKLSIWIAETKGNTSAARKETYYRQRLRGLVELLSDTGARIGEARSTRWRHWQPGELTLSGKTNERVIQISDHVEAALMQWRVDTTEFFGKEPEGDHFVFQEPDHKEMKAHDRQVRQFLKYAGMEIEERSGKPYTTYSLRHGFASSRKIAGTDQLVLARSMGTSQKMLEEHYIDVPTPHTRQELAKGSARRREAVAHDTFAGMRNIDDPKEIAKQAEDYVKARR